MACGALRRESARLCRFPQTGQPRGGRDRAGARAVGGDSRVAVCCRSSARSHRWRRRRRGRPGSCERTPVPARDAGDARNRVGTARVRPGRARESSPNIGCATARRCTRRWWFGSPDSSWPNRSTKPPWRSPERSGIEDVTSIPIGYPIKIPVDLLEPRYLPAEQRAPGDVGRPSSANSRASSNSSPPPISPGSTSSSMPATAEPTAVRSRAGSGRRPTPTTSCAGSRRTSRSTPAPPCGSPPRTRGSAARRRTRPARPEPGSGGADPAAVPRSATPPSASTCAIT